MIVAGAILAGGQSSRMGRTKALIEIDGQPMARRVAMSLTAAGVAPVVIYGGGGMGYCSVSNIMTSAMSGSTEEVRNVMEIKAAHVFVKHEHRNQHGKVTNSVRNESLLSCLCLAHILVPVTDEEVGACSHTFPAQEEYHKVGTQDQVQHRENEQIEVQEELIVASVPMHISNGIDMNERSNTCHNHRHNQRYFVEAVVEINAKNGAIGIIDESVHPA